MDIEGLAEFGHAHRGALDVPPRSALAPGRAPHGSDLSVYVLGLLPEREVADVVLVVLVGGDAFAAAHLFEVDARELAVVGEGRDVEVDGLVDDVGASVLDESRDEGDHLVDVPGRSWVDISRSNAERFEIFEETADDGLGELVERDALFEGSGNGLVVDVGQVGDEGDVVPLPLEVPVEKVIEEERPVVADVRELVDGRPAGVHADGSRLERLELLEFAG